MCKCLTLYIGCRSSISFHAFWFDYRAVVDGVGMWMCILQYAVENEELTQHLGAAKDAQRQLTAEVMPF